jgi:hypothetical protein
MMRSIRIIPRLAFALVCSIALSASVYAQGKGRIIETKPKHEDKTDAVSVDLQKLRQGEVWEELKKKWRVQTDAQKTSI